MDAMNIYNHMPTAIQNTLCSIAGLGIKRERYNKRFWELLNDAVGREAWSYERKCEYRDKKLRALVRHAIRTTSYYRTIFKEYGLNENSIKRLEDLKQLPMIHKEMVKAHFCDFQAEGAPKKEIVKLHTSGSTGSGFVFYSTREAFLRQWANGWRWYHNLGIMPGEWCGHFSGRMIVPTQNEKPPFARINYPCRQVFFSAYHMRPEWLDNYTEEISRRGLKWLHGYPSSLTILAQYMMEHAIRLDPPVRHITVCSENLLPFQKKALQEAFGAYPYQNYAQTEGVAVFTENEKGILRVDEDFAAVEFVEDEEGRRHVVGTNLWNYAMPLLRYDTGDLAEESETPEGRFITRLDGRQEDVVVLADGSRIGRLDHLFKDMKNVNAAQIVQKEKGKITIYIVRAGGYGEADEQILRKELKNRFQSRLRWDIVYTDSVEKGANGKLRFVANGV